MSANGDSTRDWLLKKLLKASGVLKEQEVSLKLVSAERDSLIATNLRLESNITELQAFNQQQADDYQRAKDNYKLQRDDARQARNNYREENAELRRRVRQLAPSAQFKIMYQPDAYGTQFKPIALSIESVESANGVTTIRTRWPQNVELQPVAQPLQFANVAVAQQAQSVAPEGWDNTEEFDEFEDHSRSPAIPVFNGPHGCS
jgi:hypothetical protein